ncbi:chloride channel protein [Acidihalobacter ferrooxydans]|uniref:Chloride channel protein n=1 Tax=Acidihalobacter ferrooxydans TaxID=1765967 RepID=A0A1P8UID8_9GAMM|nr:chloride channel protein [Acidihalobacter ferrooxydans]APZ43554.1 hypothetical protein BW247_11020 [Acidihalobacter ferrooxydans]
MPGHVPHRRRERLYLRLNGLALVVGGLAGLCALGFGYLLALAHNLLYFGRIDPTYDLMHHSLPATLGIGVMLLPAAGALLTTWLLRHYASGKHDEPGPGISEIIHAVHFERGAMLTRSVAVRYLAAAVTLGSGGSGGHEGPIIQFSSALASGLSGRLRLPEWERLTLVACGAGGAIGATFNVPAGGILFAVELILLEISGRTLIPVMLATGAAMFVSRSVLGAQALFPIPSLNLSGVQAAPPEVYLAYAVLGVCMGLVATVYIRTLYASIDLFARLPGGLLTRHLVGMLLLGVLLYASFRLFGHYYVQGIGFATIQDILNGSDFVIGLLLALGVLKLLATCLTLGSGGVGGVISPALYMGATLGGAFGLLAHHWMPGLGVSVSGAAVIGMACMVGASTGAAVTAVVMVFEMTRDFHVIIPLIIAVSLAYGLRRLLLADNIFLRKLSRRGERIPVSLRNHLQLLRDAASFLHTPFMRVAPETSVATVRQPLRSGDRVPHLLLTQPDGGIAGVVEARVLLEAALEARVGQLAQARWLAVRPDAPVFDVIGRLRREQAALAVLTSTAVPDVESVLGILGPEDLLHSAAWPVALTDENETQTKASRD